ncbi:MAG: hypothetical protein ABIJ45_00290 [Candidatus Zixiibacteriota bacterium]
MIKIIRTIFITCLALAALSLFTAIALAEESQMTEKKDIPEAVMASLKKAYPEAEIMGKETSEIDDKVYYEFELIIDEAEKDVVYLADGSLYSVEHEIAVKDIPQNVAEALKKAYPMGEIDEADMIMKGSEISYEVIMEVKEAEEVMAYEITVGADGTITHTEQIMDEGNGDEEDIEIIEVEDEMEGEEDLK